jgi:adenylate cyclase
MGDAVMVVGPDAAALVTVLAGLAGAVHRHPVLSEVRAAVAAGDLLARDGDYFGPDVNIAARAVAEAEPGSVVVTEAVAALLPNPEPIGARALRGVDDPVPLFRAGSPGTVDG